MDVRGNPFIESSSPISNMNTFQHDGPRQSLHLTEVRPTVWEEPLIEPWQTQEA